jgi:predicted O-methyltransferase YrrM
MHIFKQAIKQVLRRNGYELSRLYASDLEYLPPSASFSFREVHCYNALRGISQLSLDEARFLGSLVLGSDPTRPIIEIGTLFGFSTLVMTLFKRKEQRLITVDNYSWNPLGLSSEAHFMLTRDRLAEATEDHNVRVVRADRREFYRSFSDRAPALFFCDADHTYEATKEDLLWARSVGASVICGDDYDPGRHEGVVKAVDELGGPRQRVGGLFVL